MVCCVSVGTSRDIEIGLVFKPARTIWQAVMLAQGSEGQLVTKNWETYMKSGPQEHVNWCPKQVGRTQMK